MSENRNSQVSRIYRILNILGASRQGLSASQINDRLEGEVRVVNSRTIYRDLDLLRSAGYPLVESGRDEDNGIRWKLAEDAVVVDNLKLSPNELLALYMARNLLSPLRETPFYDDLDQVFLRIEDKLGKENTQHLSEIQASLAFEPGPLWGLGLDSEIIDTLRSACAERQVLTITYQTSTTGEIRAGRRLGPHLLYFVRGGLYLIAEDLDVGKIKTFAASRIKAAEMTTEPYDKEPIDPREHFGATMGVYRGEGAERVVIECHPPVAAFVKERRWHATQKVVSKENGVIEVHLEVAITPELVQWVLGLGSAAKALAPQSLVDMIGLELDSLRKRYLRVAS